MKKISFVLALMCSVALLSSCDKDDNKDQGPTPPAISDMYGDYDGKMTFTKDGETLTPLANMVETGADVAAVVRAEEVHFDNFPINDLVIAVVGPEQATGIIAAVGKVSYTLDYQAKFNEDETAISMTLAPEILTIIIPGETPETNAEVKVTISVVDKGSYTYKSDKMQLELRAESVTLAGAPIDIFVPMNLTFDLTKK